MIPPFFTDYDLLKFEGERANEVRDVRVEIRDLEQVDYPEIDEAVTYAALRRRGPRRRRGRPFDAIELRNPNDDDVAVKVALMSWGERPEDDPQQFEWAIPLDDVVTGAGQRPQDGQAAAGSRRRPRGDDRDLRRDPSHAEDAVADVSEWRVRAGRKREP